MKLIVTESNPENTAGALAIKLAEAYNAVAAHETDARTFNDQARAEARKIQECRNALMMLREREREDRKQAKAGLPPIQRSRMDPLATYDRDLIEQEIEMLVARQGNLQDIADGHTEKAKAAKIEIPQLRKAIDEANAKARADREKIEQARAEVAAEARRAGG